MEAKDYFKIGGRYQIITSTGKPIVGKILSKQDLLIEIYDEKLKSAIIVSSREIMFSESLKNRVVV